MQRETGVATSGGDVRRALHFAPVAALAALIAACATTPELPLLPAVTSTPSGVTTPGKFVWGDLISHDVEASKKFYGSLLGWSFETNGRYTTVSNRGRPIAGIVRAVEDERGTEWIGNLSVADVDRATAVFAERGGVVEREPEDAPHRGRISLVSTKGGAILLLVNATGGDPPDADPEVGGWLWWEFWTHDPQGAVDLLSAVAGYQSEDIVLDDTVYRVVRDPQARRAGIVHAPPEVHPTWLPYFRVGDIDVAVKRAVELGARLVDRNERNAILVDPNQAEFALSVWAKETDRIMQEAE